MKDREFPRTAPLYVIGAVLTLLGCLAFATPSVAGKWVVAMLGGFVNRWNYTVDSRLVG